jgi:regulator of RNase E activity RraA
MTQTDPWIEYLQGIDTPTLANAVELLQCRPNSDGFTPLGVRCLFPELGRLCGYAVTAHVETVTATEPCDPGMFVRLYEQVEQSLKPAVIAFQEVGAHPDYAAHCGEVMGTIFTRLGAAGLVSDCGVRDLPEVRRLGFRYFARGTVASHANFRTVRVGISVQILGMVVHPGDVLHGDENGVLVIPAGAREKLAEKVDEVREREQELMRYVRGPDFNLAGLHDRIVK